ncbi:MULTISPECIES: hypothetical protein [Methanobacterium]|jgi:ketosteroid isomerase-like protein|uniref:Uncharacterized protein n=1 Tax=Methanobacterium veterum TaxID=408577 RepID=A0A9E4ZTE0_9EURY|nr:MULTISPECIES: hypothetical protein [Methanobacterium]MCZ3364819.1 hypothetical protein [Methanobacterium veterum]MCZ3372573.1 hypothetical protein [Methanobacterium veterum]
MSRKPTVFEDRKNIVFAALEGLPFNNTYCWIVQFKNNIIVEVRAYVDSALVQKVIEENET